MGPLRSERLLLIAISAQSWKSPQGLSQTDQIITGPPAGLVDGSVVNAVSSNEAEIE
jgi:hypothetical protein